MDSKILPIAAIAGLAMLVLVGKQQQTTSPTQTGSNVDIGGQPTIVQTPATQALKEFQKTFQYIDTGEVTPMGSQVISDGTAGGAMVLRTGIVDIIGSLAPKVYSCEMRSGYYSFSNGKCYGTLPEYCAKYPGADICRTAML